MEKGKKVEKAKSKSFVFKQFEKLIWSFDNTSSGFSARKLSAFIAICVAIYVTVKIMIGHDNQIHDNILYIIGIWLIFALLCLGIITAEQLIRFKDGVSKNEDDNHDEPAIEKAPKDDVKKDEPKKDEPKKDDSSEDPII